MTNIVMPYCGVARMAGGRYGDEFQKIDGQWLYSKRIFNIVAQTGDAPE